MNSYSRIALGVMVLTGAACTGGVERSLNEVKQDVTELRGLQAEQSAELNKVKEELRSLAGQMEEIQYRTRGRTEQLERTIRILGTRVPPPQGVPEGLLISDEQAIARIAGPAADQFRKGLELVRTGDFEQAKGIFEEFFRENPGTAFSDNALFWTGISYFKLGQYDRAIVSFSEVFEKFPAEDRVSAALFHLAEAFEQIGQKEDARVTYRKLADEFPKTEYGAEAKKKLKGR